MWTAVNTLIKGNSHVNNKPAWASQLTPEICNAHFVSVFSEFLPDDQTEGSQYICPDRLPNVGGDRTSQNNTFSIFPISVFEVGIS